jgi:hypothetical protein
MASSLRERITGLAARFAEEVIAAVSESVDERLAQGGTGGLTFGRKAGRVVRRSADALAEVGERIVAALGREPKGIRSEDLRAAIGLSRAEMFRPIGMLLAAGRIRKTGQKRRTVYFVEAGAAASPGKSGKKRAGKPKKAPASRPGANGKRAPKKAKGAAAPAPAATVAQG